MKKANATGKGFTLVEMLVVLGIAAVLMAVAVPAFGKLMTAQQMSSFTSAFVMSLNQARSEAIKRNARIIVCKSANAKDCTGSAGWEQGWIMFHDPNNNAEREEDETIIHQHGSAGGDLRMRGNSNVAHYVSYGATGNAKLVSGAFQSGTFTVCPPLDSGLEARQIILSPTGRPRTQKVASASYC